LTVAAGVSAARSFLTCRLKFSRDASAVVGSGESRSFSMRAQRWVCTETPESPAASSFALAAASSILRESAGACDGEAISSTDFVVTPMPQALLSAPPPSALLASVAA